jgi:hypothetical protein
MYSKEMRLTWVHITVITNQKKGLPYKLDCISLSYTVSILENIFIQFNGFSSITTVLGFILYGIDRVPKSELLN